MLKFNFKKLTSFGTLFVFAGTIVILEGNDITLDYLADTSFSRLTDFVQINRYDKILQATFLESGWYHKASPDPEVIKLFSCSTQLSIKFFLLINVKMPTIVGI